MNKYFELLDYWRKTVALQQLAGLASWDRETYMPPLAAEQRSEQAAVISQIIHQRLVSDELGELIEALSVENLELERLTNLRLIVRDRNRAMKVPSGLASEIAKTTSLAVGKWSEAKEEESTSKFLPILLEIVSLKREEGKAISENCDPYEALLHDFEPSLSLQWLDEAFGQLRTFLVQLRHEIMEQADEVDTLQRVFPKNHQFELAKEVAGLFGYDWKRGRLDISKHPFTSGSWNDVRITTRINEQDIIDCLYSTIHETGHAIYEQNIKLEYAMTPLGKESSLGIHESQARFFENQIGRSKPFSRWLYQRLKQKFGNIGIYNDEDFFKYNNRLTRGFIRTEADEVQYNLHIMLRYDLEQQLIRGELEVNDLEDAWNDRFATDFGFAVDKPSNGLLQDIHWSSGCFGYFPTYTLGNIFSGCLYQAMQNDLPELDESLNNGDPSPAVDWMKAKIHCHGALYNPMEMLRRATSLNVTVEPLIQYLQEKFSAIYGL